MITNDPTEAALFGGGAGSNVGAKWAGFRQLWNIELDPRIAAVAELNGFATMVADVCAVDFTTLAAPYWLHMSPPCTRASQANANAEESPLDQALADACIRAIRTLRPRRISLENVWGYRTFQAFRSILAALASEGYCTDFWHLNAASYGVPQTRKRLMLVASLDHQPRRPPATHTERQPYAGQFAMFDGLPPWRGWYAAIEDLIPTLPDSQFAPWQLERLPAELKETMLIGLNKSEYSPDGITPAEQDEPAFTVTQQATRLRAFVVDCIHRTDAPLTVRQETEPYFTLASSHFRRDSNMPRAFILDQLNASSMTVRNEHEPVFTLARYSAKHQAPRAFIVDGANNNPPRDAIEPAPTLAGYSDRSRAYVGRVVKMTPRCLTRFNGLPDTYRLPDSPTLACTVLGNMVPPGLLQPAMEANR